MTRTQGEVEAQIGSDILKFFVDLFSRGPKSIEVNMLPHSAVVVTQNNFTNAEKHLISDGPHQHSFKDMRSCMIESKIEELKSIVENASGVVVKCMHHDVTAEEEAFIFSLRDKPEYRINGNGKFRFVKS
jgi:uncharacterized protein YbcI